MESVEIKTGRTITKILITSATGFIGGALAQRWTTDGLQQAGDIEIRALVRNLQLCQTQGLAKLGVATGVGRFDEPCLVCGSLLRRRYEISQ